MVLKRSTLPVAQPLPQPSAGRRKYGTPVAGLLGAQSALVLPVAITPTFSPMTSNEVLLVIRTTQRSVSAPRLVTVIGYWVWLKVAVAALKFADLQNFRGTSYVFDLDRFSSFEGKTGPYLLYQAVRVKSLLRKAEAEGSAPGPITVTETAERDLVLLLDAFDQALVDHFEHADLVRGTEAVLHGAQDAELVAAVAFEIEDGVDHMFEHARAGDLPVFRHMPYQNQREPA